MAAGATTSSTASLMDKASARLSWRNNSLECMLVPLGMRGNLDNYRPPSPRVLAGSKRHRRIIVRKIDALDFFFRLKPKFHFATFRLAVLFPEFVCAISDLLVCRMCHWILAQLNVALRLSHQL